MLMRDFVKMCNVCSVLRACAPLSIVIFIPFCPSTCVVCHQRLQQGMVSELMREEFQLHCLRTVVHCGDIIDMDVLILSDPVVL